MDYPRFPWDFGKILGNISSSRFNPHRAPIMRRMCTMDNAQWDYTYSHIRAKMPNVGLEPAASDTEPHAITQLPKTTLISFISFSGSQKRGKRNQYFVYFVYFIFGGPENEINAISEIRISFIFVFRKFRNCLGFRGGG